MDAPSGLCRGCHRTLEEIARWSTMSDRERKAVVGKLPGRRRESSVAKTSHS